MKKLLFFCTFIAMAINVNTQVECGTIMEDDGTTQEIMILKENN